MIADMKKTVGLNMIVKNESKIILRCLESVKDHIDHFSIVDTGSQDGTQKIITDFFRENKIEGTLHERPWVNFEVNRTEALKLAKGKTDYILLIDADMELVVNDIDWKNKIFHDTCQVRQDSDTLNYYNARIISGNLNYKYSGVTHEYLECVDSNSTTGKFDLVSMIDHADGGTRHEKFERDIKLLTRALRDDPNNARYAFYLANSYRDCGRKREAIKWYKRRIEIGGWKEEVWHSMLSMGRCHQSLDEWPSAMDNYIRAYKYHPARAEPIYEIAKYYRINDLPVLGHHFAAIGMKIPYPKDDTLFIEKDVYGHLMKYEASICACYVGDLKGGRKLCDELVFSRDTPDYIRNNCLDNMFFYLEKLDGTTIEELTTEKTKPNFNFCNPSIVNTEKGLLLNIREVSYDFDIKGNFYHYDKTIDTYNHLIELSTGRSGVIGQIKAAGIKTYENYITGLEDIRLFERESELWGVGTCRTTHPTGLNEMVAVKINDDYSISYAVRLKGYKDDECQKNWVPIYYNGSIHFIYSSDPLIILRPNLETGECAVVVNKTPRHRMGNFRGSSQVIHFWEGYLYVVHEVSHRDNRRYYHHRFVCMNSDLEIIKISEPFYFIEKTIEYCAGMCQVGNELYVTIGFEDKKAYLVRVPMQKVNDLLGILEKPKSFVNKAVDFYA